jgi:hypothetical protein
MTNSNTKKLTQETPLPPPPLPHTSDQNPPLDTVRPASPLIEVPPPPLQPHPPRPYLSPGFIAIIGLLVIIVAVVLFRSPVMPGGANYTSTVNNTVSTGVTPPLTTQTGKFFTPTTALPQKIVVVTGVPYNQVYSIDQQFKTGQKEYTSFDLTEPPMIIQLEVIPKTVSRNKLVDIGTANERYITAEYTSPNSWFEIKVTDTSTGEVLTTLGFGKGYNIGEKQEYTIRKIGNYRFEMQGNEITANVKLLVKS